MERPLPWVVFVDGALFDRRAAIDALIQHMSRCTAADLAAFRATGEYDDPWELARAANVWVAARRPKPIPAGGWRRVVNQFGGDPGDLTSRCRRMWRDQFWREESLRVAPEGLRRLAAGAQVGLCTSRSRAEALLSQERLGVPFAVILAEEDGPPADALKRLAPRGHLVGLGEPDRTLAEAAGWLYHPAGAAPDGVVERLAERLVRQPRDEAPPPAPSPSSSSSGSGGDVGKSGGLGSTGTSGVGVHAKSQA